MHWWEQLFSVRNYEDKKQLIIFGIRCYIRRSKLYRQIQKIHYQLSYFKARDFFAQHYGVKIPAECCGQGEHFEWIKLKLKEIKYKKAENKVYSLEQCAPYIYLKQRDPKIYQNYLQGLVQAGTLGSSDNIWSIHTFDSLEKSIQNNGYNPIQCAIAVDKRNMLIDGQHRCCLLLRRFGPEYEVWVVRVF